MHALARCCLSVSCPMRPIDLAARHYPYVTNLVCTQYAPLGGVFFCQTIHTQYAPLGALHARLFTLNTLLLVLVCQTIHTQYALLGIFFARLFTLNTLLLVFFFARLFTFNTLLLVVFFFARLFTLNTLLLVFFFARLFTSAHPVMNFLLYDVFRWATEASGSAILTSSLKL